MDTHLISVRHADHVSPGGIVGATGNTSATRPESERRGQRGRIGHPGPLERSLVALTGEDSRALGPTNPDPVSELLGTGYRRFQSPR